MSPQNDRAQWPLEPLADDRVRTVPQHRSSLEDPAQFESWAVDGSEVGFDYEPDLDQHQRYRPTRNPDYPEPLRPGRKEPYRPPSLRLPVVNVDPGDAGPYGDAGDEDDRDELDYDDYFDDDEDVEDLDLDSASTRNAIEWAVVLVGAVLVALVLRASLFQAYYIPSVSMETTLLVNDRVLVNKVSYRLHDVNRGDVVVFARPDDDPGEIRDLIKRVIGLPGETVEARDGSVYINGQRLDEPYLDEGVTTDDFGPTVVSEGDIFVMGDNRPESYDSRFFGGVDQERVIGRAFVLFWPVNRVGSL